MPTKKIGRPKGSRNKIPATVKENVVAVFTRMGGTAAMARWAKKNQGEFYRIYARLLPQEVKGEITFPNADVTQFTEDELAMIAAGQVTNELLARLIASTRSPSSSGARA